MDGSYIRDTVGPDHTIFDFIVINGTEVYGVFDGQGIAKGTKIWTSTTEFGFTLPLTKKTVFATVGSGLIDFTGPSIPSVRFKFARDLSFLPLGPEFLGVYSVLKSKPKKRVAITGLGLLDIIGAPKKVVFTTISIDSASKTATMSDGTSSVVLHMGYAPSAEYTDDAGVVHKLANRIAFGGEESPEPTNTKEEDTPMALILGLAIVGLFSFNKIF